MPKPRRSKLEIVADILAVLERGCKKPTHIATEANLAYDRMAKILEALKARGLVVEKSAELCITHDGLKFLEEYKKWKRLLDTLGI